MAKSGLDTVCIAPTPSQLIWVLPSMYLRFLSQIKRWNLVNDVAPIWLLASGDIHFSLLEDHSQKRMKSMSNIEPGSECTSF